MYMIGMLEESLEYRKWASDAIRSFALEERMDVDILEFDKVQGLINFCQDRSKNLDFLFLNTTFNHESTIPLVKRLKNINNGFQIVFWTDHMEDSSKCYEVEHSYLLEQSRLEYNMKHMFSCLIEKWKEKKLVIFMKGKRIVLDQENIQYMERNKRKTYIWMRETADVATTVLKIGELDERLNHRIFVRCHNSYIVNKNCVEEFYRDRFELKGGKSVPISRKYYKEIKEMFVG
ncbi:MAG: LytR/AlgR family response regulator transcription factor [Candidatus Fimousia sp.]